MSTHTSTSGHITGALTLVFIFALILWILDSGLSWLVKSVIG